MKQVLILTNPDCNDCYATKNPLQQHKNNNQEASLLKGGEQAQQRLPQIELATMPQIFVNEEPIRSFNELSQPLSNNESNLIYFKSLN